MIERLESILKRYEEVTALLSTEEVITDFKKVTKLSKEQSDLKEIVLKYQEYKDTLEHIEEAKSMKNLKN